MNTRAMNILAVDTTGEPLSLALKARGKVLRFHKTLEQPHDETILKRVDALLEKGGIALEDLDAVVAASGPGRFTGIRVGMAYAAVAASALGKRALAVSRLEAAAQASRDPLVAAVVPGWRGERFVQLFRRDERGLTAAEPPVWLDPEGWPAARARLRDRGAALVERDPDAADLLAAAEAMLAAGAKPAFEPLYLKPAGYEAKAKHQAGTKS